MTLPIEHSTADIDIGESIENFSSHPSFDNLAVYIPMPDGIKIAADIWLPVAALEGKKVPLALEFTRYWRIAAGHQPKARVGYFAQQGFAHAVVDCRGSGASFGSRQVELSRIEINDFACVINWMAEQPWCNGAVVSIGTSYSANTAELAMADAPPALKASIPRFSDFDAYLSLCFPGGLLNRGFVKPWGGGVVALDNNCIDEEAQGLWQDYFIGYLNASVKSVDEDTDGRLLQQAIVDHQANIPVHQSLVAAEYRNDLEAIDRDDRQLSPHRLQGNKRLGEIPSYHWASFNDAGTAAGAIARFMGSKAPMRVVIGYWSHGGEFDTNPYKYARCEALPNIEAQCTHLTHYLSALKSYESRDNCSLTDNPRLNERALYYYTPGAERWRKTESWPPRDVVPQRWYFSEARSLTQECPNNQSGLDRYEVDFDAGTGDYNRWNQMKSEVCYGDRAEADKRLLTYTSEPLTHAIEITGHPIVSLQMSSTQTDGSVIAYLEAVAPDGTVTMLTEGELRLIHRKASDEKPPYPVFGPYRTFEKKDALPMPVGETVEISFDCLPLSIRIEKDHALRVAIAGHDKDCFDRLPPEGEQTYDIFRTIDAASYIELPIRVTDNITQNDEIVDPFY